MKMFSLKVKNALKQKKGFTLLELVVVVAIIAVLALGVGVTAIRQIDKARVSRLVADIDTTKTAIAMYNVEVRDYPSALVDLTQADNGGPYMNRVLEKHGFGEYSYAVRDGKPILTIVFNANVPQSMKEEVYKALTGESYVGNAITNIEVDLYSGTVTALTE